MCDDKEFDERNQISKNDEERVTDGIEVFKLVNRVHRKIQITMRNNMTKEIGWILVMTRTLMKNIR